MNKFTEKLYDKGFLKLKSFFSVQRLMEIKTHAKQVFIKQMLNEKIVQSGELTEVEFEVALYQLFEQHLNIFINCGKHIQHMISLHRLSLDKELLDLIKQLGLCVPNICTRPVLYFNSPYLAKEKVYWKVWIDFNLDGDFNDNLELVAYGCGDNTLSGIITMPQNLWSGKTQMRIAMSLFRYPTGPCEVFGWGESEDYCISILSKLTKEGTLFENNKTLSSESAVLLEAASTQVNIEVHPNPADNFAIISIDNIENVEMLNLISVDGRKVREWDQHELNTKMEIQTSDLQSGLYFIRLLTKDAEVSYETVLIQH